MSVFVSSREKGGEGGGGRKGLGWYGRVRRLKDASYSRKTGAMYKSGLTRPRRSGAETEWDRRRVGG